MGIVRDVRERKKLEAQLMQARKMEAVGTLAAESLMISTISSWAFRGMRPLSSSI
jgi:hypothetical protein